MDRKKYLIVVAGGSGTRMGTSVPKQFLELDGKSVLHRTIERFVDAVSGIKVVTVLPAEHIGIRKTYCYEHGLHCPQTLVSGGITRFHSVKNGLERLPEGALVAVHDGVRPFVSAELVRRLFEKAEECPAVIPVIPCVDTIKVLECRKDDSGAARLETVPGVKADRNMLFGAQTPQVFLSDALKEAYSQAFDTSFTDDASVVESKNIPLAYVEGERYNIKITSPDDLVLAKYNVCQQRIVYCLAAEKLVL